MGIGTGPSLRYFADAGVSRVVGVEPNLAMHPIALEEARLCGLDTADRSRLELVGAFAEELPLPSASFDVVVATMVMCSVRDVEAAAREIHRILRPGGRYLFIEHVAAPRGSVLRGLQAFYDPLQQAFADGCHLTRNPLPLIERAGFSDVQSSYFTLGQTLDRQLSPAGGSPASNRGWRPRDGPPRQHFLLSPHLAGIATKEA